MSSHFNTQIIHDLLVDGGYLHPQVSASATKWKVYAVDLRTQEDADTAQGYLALFGYAPYTEGWTALAKQHALQVGMHRIYIADMNP